MPRSAAVFLLAIAFAAVMFATPAVASGCVDAASCKECVSSGCPWCASSLNCTPSWIPSFVSGCSKAVNEAAQCTPLRDSLVRLGDSMPAVSEKLVCAYDFVKDKIAA